MYEGEGLGNGWKEKGEEIHSSHVLELMFPWIIQSFFPQDLFILARTNGGRGRGRGRESQADSVLSTEPNTGHDPTTLIHDLSQN